MQVGECSGAERPFLACWHPQSRFWLSRPLVRARQVRGSTKRQERVTMKFYNVSLVWLPLRLGLNRPSV